MSRARRADGTVSLELVLLAPFLLAIMLLVVAFGRHANVQGYVDQAARDAARSATANRDMASARAAVRRTIEADLDSAPRSCRHSAQHEVRTSHGNLFVASNPYSPTRGAGLNVVTVTVSCEVNVSDLAFIGFGQTMGISSTFSSPMPAVYGTYQ